MARLYNAQSSTLCNLGLTKAAACLSKSLKSGNKKQMSHVVSNSWFAVQVIPKMETRVARVLTSKNIDNLLPTYNAKRIWSDRVKILKVPLFPGYVFCRLYNHAENLAVTTYGVIRTVSFGGKPYPLSEAELAALQTLSSGNAEAIPCPFQHVGHRVRIENGPLAGVVGVIIGNNKRHQLVISIEMLMRSVVVNIDPSSVQLVAA